MPLHIPLLGTNQGWQGFHFVVFQIFQRLLIFLFANNNKIFLSVDMHFRF